MPLNNVIRVNARVTSAGAAPVNFGRALFLRPGVKATDLARFAKHGVDPVTYATLDAVAADYAISDDAHLAASKWFRQEPFPSQMLVGMRFAADIESRVYGGAPASVATIEAHGDDTAITFNGANYEVDLDSRPPTSPRSGRRSRRRSPASPASRCPSSTGACWSRPTRWTSERASRTAR